MKLGPTTLAAALGVLAVAGCQQNAPAPAAAPSEQASAAEGSGPDAKPGITASEGVLIVPVVKGRPGAAYFSVTNGSAAAVTLAAVAVEGAAKAEMHETKGGSMTPLGTLEIKPGETVKFERGGRHVMAFDLGQSVSAGSTTEMTLVFAGGDKLSLPLKVESVTGTDHSGMAKH